ncbi:MAG: methionine synthase [Alphaproteobacteria bacterium]|nr:methionine synthase [Alphaproteobacteria bacterium]
MGNKADELVKSIAEMDEEKAIDLANQMLAEGVDPLEVLRLCRVAMDIVGERFEKQEYFLPELMMAGDMLEQIGAIVKPLLMDQAGGEEPETLGTIVLGTVHGDLHDIGKNIVTFMLELNGFKVIDLGIDVPIEKFIDAIEENQPQVVALSGFLTLAFDSMKETVEAIAEAGWRDKVKIMIGGGQIDEQVTNYTGADAFGKNAMEAVSLCNEWIGGAA